MQVERLPNLCHRTHTARWQTERVHGTLCNRQHSHALVPVHWPYYTGDRTSEMTTNLGPKTEQKTFFFLKFFGRLQDIPAKSRNIPPKKFDFPGSEGHAKTFWSSLLHVEDPYPTGKYPDSKVWVWVLFLYLTITTGKGRHCKKTPQEAQFFLGSGLQTSGMSKPMGHAHKRSERDVLLSLLKLQALWVIAMAHHNHGLQKVVWSRWTEALTLMAL